MSLPSYRPVVWTPPGSGFKPPVHIDLLYMKEVLLKRRASAARSPVDVNRRVK